VVDEPVVDEPVVDEPVVGEAIVEDLVDVAVIEEPPRRRGLFGRRQRGHVKAVTVDQAVAEPADAEVESVPAAEAPFPEPVAAPVAGPEPVAVAAVYFATAIDILPGRAMGRRGKHATPVPTHATPETPAAPVASYPATARLAPVGAPPVRALSAPPLEAPASPSAVSAPSATEPSPFDQIPVQQVPVGPAAIEHAPTEVDQPMVSATMSELDQLALNAELQKSALSELRSLYEPAYQGPAPVAEAPVGLIRRQRRAVEPVVEVEQQPEASSRSRDAGQVRGMLSGFRAGVERGRSATSDEPHDVDRGDSARDGTPSADTTSADNTTD
jgi:hypothetical protein